MKSASGWVIGDAPAARAVQLLVASLTSAAAAHQIAYGDMRTLTAAGLGLLIVAAMMRWPALTIVALLIICQELRPSPGFGGPSASPLLFLGHQVYFQNFARISGLTLVVLLGLGRVAIGVRASQPRRIAALLPLGLGLYYIALLWDQGTSLTTAINQDARFAILFGACFAIGAFAAGSREWTRNAIPVLQWVLTAMALIGLYLAASGQGFGGAGTTIIFYDSATSAIAGAAVLAACLTPVAERNWRTWWLASAGLIVVVLAARRNVWAAMIVALLLGLIVNRRRARLVLRALGAAAVVLVGLAILAPLVLSGVGHQLSAGPGARRRAPPRTPVRGSTSATSPSAGMRSQLRRSPARARTDTSPASPWRALDRCTSTIRFSNPGLGSA